MTRARSLNLFIIDFLSFYFALILSLLVRFGFNQQIFLAHLVSFTILFLLWFLVFYAFQLYESQDPGLIYYQNYFLAVMANIAIGVLLFYLLGPYFKVTPKRFFALFIAFFLMINLIFRRRFGFLPEKKKIVFLNNDSEAPEADLYVLSFQNKGFLPLAEKLLLQGKEVLSVTDYNELFFQKISLAELEKEIFFFKVEKKGNLDLVKRIFDFFLAVFIIILSLPLWPIVILGIKLSSKGPIFYLDQRIGFQERYFFLYKFRTMHKESLVSQTDFRKEKEARVFFFGKILRKFHLDELPQVINIIRGDLSLVGPRPDSAKYYQILKEKIPFYRLRTIVKPGITGWAQIKSVYGDSVEEAKDRLAYDLYYIKHRNLIFDLLILLKTLSIVFRGK